MVKEKTSESSITMYKKKPKIRSDIVSCHTWTCSLCSLVCGFFFFFVLLNVTQKMKSKEERQMTDFISLVAVKTTTMVCYIIAICVCVCHCASHVIFMVLVRKELMYLVHSKQTNQTKQKRAQHRTRVIIIRITNKKHNVCFPSFVYFFCVFLLTFCLFKTRFEEENMRYWRVVEVCWLVGFAHF